jgi:3-oxoacyl-[acyl-carrier-protein] synthase I
MTAASTHSPLAAVAVLGMGASSPIGYGVRPIQAAMAGGIRNFRAATLLAWNREPARISRLPDVDEAVPRAERIALLIRLAVADLLASLQIELPGSLPVFVGCAHDSPDSELDTIGGALADGSEGLLNPGAANPFTGYRAGRIAFLSALAKALRSFEEGAGELALIVAADTRCTGSAMDALFRKRRLLTSQDDGTIPGEAAIVVLVASPNSQLAAQALFMLGRPAFATDEFETLRRSPLAADGLSRVFRALREHPTAGAVRPGTAIAFETGEVFFTRAFMTGYLRNAELMPEPLQHELIAANLGDTGAAAAGMALVRAEWLLRRQETGESPRVLIYGHADSGRCAAAVAIGRSRGMAQ